MTNKKYYPKIEHSIVFMVFLAIVIFLVPFSLENTRQASYISKWNEVYNKMEYLFSVIDAHVSDDMLKGMKKAQSAHEREQVLLMIIKPYIRVNENNIPSKRYKPRFKNGNRISKDNLYYFDEFYNTKKKIIVGIKNIHTESKKDPLFIMMFDVNGVLPPNRWGNDIFGLNIYDGGKIEPFGYDKTLETLKEDCSETGSGIGCSYYYKIGGGF